MWLEDTTGDGQADLIQEETRFNRFCECSEMTKLGAAPAEAAAWRPPVRSRLRFASMECGDFWARDEENDLPCAVAGRARRTVTPYDAARDRW